MAARKWTREQRLAQAEKIKQWQPWKSSTGARTVEGRETSAKNAFKGGLYQKVKQLRKVLIEQKKVLKYLGDY